MLAGIDAVATLANLGLMEVYTVGTGAMMNAAR